MAKIGRPRSFDRDEAIHQAMLLFWQHGYEATSLALLKAGMGGISSPSFYAAFDSKEALFKEVVARYVDSYGQVVNSLSDDSLPPKQAVELALRRSARMQTEEGHPRGCLLVVAASTCSPEHYPIQALLAQLRAQTRAHLLACVQRGIVAGELAPLTEATAFAALLDSFLMGITISACDGVPFASLEAAITQLMRLWTEE